MKSLFATAGSAILLTAAPSAAGAQGRPVRQAPPRSEAAGTDAVARIYESLSARPGWPAQSSESEVDASLARRGLNPEQRRAIIAALKQDVCRMAGMAPICRYYGAETIYKIQKLSWAREAMAAGPEANSLASPSLDLRMKLLEYGSSKNFQRLYPRGMSDGQKAALFSTGPAKFKWGVSFESRFSTWLSCSNDSASLWGSLPPEYNLVTCGAGFGFAMWITIFNWSWAQEWDALVTNSWFFRRVLLLWWPTGSEPDICSDSVINGSGNQKCNPNNWYSPPSPNFQSNGNPLASVVSKGSATRMGHGFSVNIVHQ